MIETYAKSYVCLGPFNSAINNIYRRTRSLKCHEQQPSS